MFVSTKALSWLLTTSFQTGILILIILLIRSILKDKINRSFLNLLWILIIINLVLPFSFKTSFSIYNIVEKELPETILMNTMENKDTSEVPLVMEAIDEIMEIEDMEETNKQLASTIKKVSKEDRFGTIWGLGVLIASSIFLYAMIRFRKEKDSFIEVKDENIINLLEKHKKNLKIKRKIKIYTSENTKGPYIYGIIDPYIYIPEEILKKFTLKDIDYILVHELSHYKKGDIIINHLQILALAIHWFNPLVWIASKAMKEDRELACDVYAINSLTKEDRISYGETLLRFVQLNNFSKDELYPVCFKEGESQMKKRIKSILNYKRQGFIKKSLLVILALALGIFLMTGKKTLDKKDINNGGRVEKDSIIQIEGHILPIKYFYTLERALDFVEFTPQLPKDKEYEVSLIRLIEDDYYDKSTTDIKIILVDQRERKMLELTASKRDIIPEDYMRFTKDKKIGRIKGKENARGDERKFYWERKGIYYILEHELNDEELAKTLKSFSNLSQEEIREVKTKSSEDKVNIYRDKDFEKAVEILGFTPKIIEKIEGYKLERASVDVNHSIENFKNYYVAQYGEVIKNMGMKIEISKELDERPREEMKIMEINKKQINSYKYELEPGQYIYSYVWKEDDLFTEVIFTGNTGSSGFRNVDEEYRERVIKKILEH